MSCCGGSKPVPINRAPKQTTQAPLNIRPISIPVVSSKHKSRTTPAPAIVVGSAQQTTCPSCGYTVGTVYTQSGVRLQCTNINCRRYIR